MEKGELLPGSAALHNACACVTECVPRIILNVLLEDGYQKREGVQELMNVQAF